MSDTLVAVQQRIADLAAALVAADPQMPTHLRAIHSTLIQHEELAHLLSEEEIGQIIAAQCKMVNVSLAVEASKARKSAVGKISAADL